jgi:titin
MLSTVTVTNTDDSGAGSLRQAIIDSSSDSEIANAIYFDIPGDGVQTINLLSALPALTQRVTIDRTTQSGNDGQYPLIQIDGSEAGEGAVGLDVEASASGSSFHGLSITGFSVGGMLVVGASNVAIVNDDIGLVQNSSGVLVHGDGDFGVELMNGASNNGLAGDVISGQAGNGVVFIGSETVNNLIEDCEIGTDPSGMSAVDSANHSLAYAWSGIAIGIGASDNQVSDDVISNNGQNGVIITGTGTTGNVVEGSFIGTNGLGSAPLPNYNGVLIQNGASDNTIGALSVGGPSNVIAGNTWDGVHIVDSGTTGNVVAGNYIGISPIIPSDGYHATQLPGPLGNGQSGVAIFAGASDNTVGGTATGSGNVISANDSNGVYISDSGTTDNVVAGDLIGTDSSGSYSVPNHVGVLIQNGAAQNTIGGITSTVSDVISGNTWDGVEIAWGASSNVVEGDYIGLTSNGNSPLGNQASGVSIYGGATGNTIGGTAAGTVDLIAYNAQNGVYIGGSGTTGNMVEGVSIIYNGNNGVQFDPNATQNMIENDLLADNGASGVYFAGGSYANVVADCVIEDNTWGIYDAGSGDTYSQNVVFGNTMVDYVRA